MTLLLPFGMGCGSKSKRGALEPLTAPSWTTQLEVKGFGPATVALPLGAKTLAHLAVDYLAAGR